ncbi:MAG: DUF6184 family natural product biosynthesis lipoprotein [Polyangiaceae bacterium]|jgi:hypothetical protein
MNTLRLVCSSLAAGALTVIGCSHNTPSPVAGTEEPQGVMNQQNAADDRVVGDLTKARCDHEENCNDVGGGKKYASRDSCMDQVRGSTANDLNAYNCPRGIDDSALGRCLQSLRSEQCGLSMGTITRLADCRSASLCLK